MGAVEASAPSACPQQREAHEAHVTVVVASQFIQEGGTSKPPGPLRSQAVDQQDRNPVGLLVGPGIQCRVERSSLSKLQERERTRATRKRLCQVRVRLVRVRVPRSPSISGHQRESIRLK
ncbi:hypothetical protein NDU88_004362 [Pleurodeles waltl]|uniref:Uncharacterized protein n=1 Tax=Pleurodeles waltl TaxID=8319 RepID=A0AAV7KY73_PLEWA|nr:hypothetical protein NDU88_004362 [Pleurodeles waltl]